MARLSILGIRTSISLGLGLGLLTPFATGIASGAASQGVPSVVLRCKIVFEGVLVKVNCIAFFIIVAAASVLFG